jgi:glycosyltransferase involved in cell wall biosynthesis
MMSTKRKKILVLTDWFLPGYKAGGPIRSLANLIATLKDVDFYVVTRNTDHYSTLPYAGIPSNEWVKHSDNCQVMYLDEQHIQLKAFIGVLKEQKFDKIYLNSLFSPKFTLVPLVAIKRLKLQHKTILAPRGMLKAGALSIKARKKRLFLMSSKVLGLFNGIHWHATSNEEIEEIQHHFPKAQTIHFAPNLATAIGDKPIKTHKNSGQLKLVCIARISAEKGIKEALAFLKDAALHGVVTCDFYGTIQNIDFLNECRSLALQIPNVQIEFKGEIAPHLVPSTLQHYHFFYMPTWGENFGHAIAEALNSATPLIISDKTPWQNLHDQHAGWDLPLESHSFTTVLQQCLLMDHTSYLSYCEGAYQLALSKFQDPEKLKAQYKLFA